MTSSLDKPAKSRHYTGQKPAMLSKYFNDHYGSRRGFLRHVKFGCQHKLGLFQSFKEVDWNEIKRLVFICKGNICRSPLGEAYAKHLGAESVSYGLACDDGDPADSRAIDYAQRLGIDMRAHRTQNINRWNPTRADLMIVMEPLHLDLFPEVLRAQANITLAGLWLPDSHPYIHDPYSSNALHFDKCEAKVISAVEKIVAVHQRSASR